MAEETLGDAGATAASAVFLFLHYCLLTAYVVQGGQLLAEALGGADTFVAAPAFAASIYGHEAALSTLLQAGASANAVNDDGWSPLFAACFGGKTPCARRLLEASADVTIHPTSGLHKGKRPLDICRETTTSTCARRSTSSRSS